jgi:hypothetical protein
MVDDAEAELKSITLTYQPMSLKRQSVKMAVLGVIVLYPRPFAAVKVFAPIFLKEQLLNVVTAPDAPINISLSALFPENIMFEKATMPLIVIPTFAPVALF